MNYLISVVNPGAMERVCEIAATLDLPQTVAMLGHGTAAKSMLDLLGIESTEKRVIMTVANPEKTRQFIKDMRQQLYIGIPGHGIVMAVPIKSVGGGKTLTYLNNGEQQPARYTPELNGKYELIVIVANEGRTDQVMNAARAAGATGGTVLHGKGTGSQNPKKFYNVSIAAEKEVILMVAQTDRKAAIMQSVLHQAGPDSEAGAILFSLPVSEVAGFGLMEEAADWPQISP